jgi:predicted nucleotidyltransferase
VLEALASDPRIAEACRRRHVRSLSLFGSAARNDFDAARSDLDFLVTFEPMPPSLHADCFFGLQEDLEAAFGRPVDLVEPKAIRNAVFAAEVRRTERPLFHAG